MNTDIRLKIGFTKHPKTIALVDMLGYQGVFALLELWLFAATYHPRGDLKGMSETAIAHAAGWPQERAAELIGGLEKCGWLDKKTLGNRHGTSSFFYLHDWHVHQAWASHHEDRAKAASLAAKTKWTKIRNDAQRTTPNHAPRNPPSPSPTPIPSPSPFPNPAHRVAQQPATLDAALKAAVDSHDLDQLTKIAPRSDPHTLKQALERERINAPMQKPPGIKDLP